MEIINFFIIVIGMIACLAFLLKKICIGERRFLKLILGILAVVFYIFIWGNFALGEHEHPLGVVFMCFLSFMPILLPIIVICLLLKNSSRVLKIIIASIFICCGIYFTFQAFPGPYDSPYQWINCIVSILVYTILLASFLSAIPIVVYKFITKT